MQEVQEGFPERHEVSVFGSAGLERERERVEELDDSDEYCPHCDNQYVIEAKTPQLGIGVEGEDARKDARCHYKRRQDQGSHRQEVVQPRRDFAVRMRPGCSAKF
ncbi:MAG: hypothetical protein BJ554DRAFT_4861 [Olpidium bornovanus]|uniref:Uncharacterized protein n=1 Tax=Olpidium bornovanus TaxID=278681 RepID=A0A8H8DEI5_9FUNG|nr:MAG: hypothetical protein BJ554DRAFT_4861 [Olpidium bornovanus]